MNPQTYGRARARNKGMIRFLFFQSYYSTLFTNIFFTLCQTTYLLLLIFNVEIFCKIKKCSLLMEIEYRPKSDYSKINKMKDLIKMISCMH